MKPAIPPPPRGDAELYRVLSALKENVELIEGGRGNALQPLAATATLAQVIVALNALIAQVGK